jgi:5'-deoxynucleotidase YfbR-like HD superfamily hydrolase
MKMKTIMGPRELKRKFSRLENDLEDTEVRHLAEVDRSDALLKKLEELQKENDRLRRQMDLVSASLDVLSKISKPI